MKESFHQAFRSKEIFAHVQLAKYSAENLEDAHRNISVLRAFCKAFAKSVQPKASIYKESPRKNPAFEKKQHFGKSIYELN